MFACGKAARVIILWILYGRAEHRGVWLFVGTFRFAGKYRMADPEVKWGRKVERMSLLIMDYAIARLQITRVLPGSPFLFLFFVVWFGFVGYATDDYIRSPEWRDKWKSNFDAYFMDFAWQ